MTRGRLILYLGTIVLLLASLVGWYGFAFIRETEAEDTTFSGQRAFADVARQVEFGPRHVGSPGHAAAITWIEMELAAAGWTVERQTATSMDHPVINLIAKRTTEPPQLLIGAHYDTRLVSDRDPDPARRREPTPGANDGGSGVAVLLELARTLPSDSIPIWLVFFDAEDNGRIPGWDWILGSRAFVSNASNLPEKMVLVDMVGDRDLQIPMEGNSDAQLLEEIWATAAKLGHADVFVPRQGGAILDDHVPFLEANVPAVDIIDIRYEYWHTTADTPDKVSEQSLQVVGEVLWTWITGQAVSEMP